MKNFLPLALVASIGLLSGCADSFYPGPDYRRIVTDDKGRDYFIDPGEPIPPDPEIVYVDRFDPWRWGYGYTYGPWYDPWGGYGWYAPFYGPVSFGFGYYYPGWYYAPWRYPHYPYAYREYYRWHDPRWGNPVWRSAHWRDEHWHDGYHWSRPRPPAAAPHTAPIPRTRYPETRRHNPRVSSTTPAAVAPSAGPRTMPDPGSRYHPDRPRMPSPGRTPQTSRTPSPSRGFDHRETPGGRRDYADHNRGGGSSRGGGSPSAPSRSHDSHPRDNNNGGGGGDRRK